MSDCETVCEEPEVDFMLLDRIVNNDFGGNRECMIMMMQAIQRHYRYLPEAALHFLSKAIDVPLTKIYEVATFYASFSLVPKGEHILQVCTGTACHLRGSHHMVAHIRDKAAVVPGGTTADRKLTLELVNCVGACAVAPVIVIDEKYCPSADLGTIDQFIEKLYAQ